MALTFNSNILAVKAQTQLGKHSEELANISEQLSSGLRINKASDDAAGLALSESLGLKTGVYQQGVRNINDGISFLNIADGALSELSNIVTRLQELATQASNGSITNDQRSSLDEEAQALSTEYTRIATSTEFNGYKLFDGGIEELHIQMGFGTDGGVTSGIGGAIFDGTFTQNDTLSGAGQLYGSALADLDGDGHLDLVTAGAIGGNNVFVSTGDGQGNFSSVGSYVSESLGGSLDLELADVNNDGHMDIITAGTDGTLNGSVSVLLGNGDATFQAANSYTTTSNNSYDIELGDFNNDGYLDIGAAGQDANGAVYFLYGNGDGTFGSGTIEASITTTALYGATVGDINNDGFDDFISNGSAGFQGWIEVYANDGAGTLNLTNTFQSQDIAGQDVELYDLNGDGNLDLISSGYSNMQGQIDIQYGNGDFTFGTRTRYEIGTLNPADLNIVDFNSDGIMDLIGAGQMGGGGPGIVYIMEGNADGTFQDAVIHQSGTAQAYPKIALGDINEDGALDGVAAGFIGGPASITTTFISNTTDGVSALSPFDLSTLAGAKQAIPIFDIAQENLSLHRGEVGAFQSRLGTALSTTSIAVENMETARSRIRDVDVAAAAAELTSTQIKKEAAIAVLAQANEQPSLVLNLLES